MQFSEKEFESYLFDELVNKAYSNWYMTAQDQVNYDYKNFIRNGRLQKD